MSESIRWYRVTYTDSLGRKRHIFRGCYDERMAVLIVPAYARWTAEAVEVTREEAIAGVEGQA